MAYRTRTVKSHQRFATVYYYVKEPGKTSGNLGVCLLQNGMWEVV